MDIQALIKALSNHEAYPYKVHNVDVCQTHISVVFLAGEYAYKVKKPLNLGFLDFSSLEKRHYFCKEEVRLNRRLAPEVYLGVVPITENSGIRVEGKGKVIEWAVKMKRLPEKANLLNYLSAGNIEPSHIRELAHRMAAFHAENKEAELIGTYGCFDMVAKNARDNFEQSKEHVGKTVHPIVFDMLRTLTEEHLEKFRVLISKRAKQGMPRNTHGDLRLNHIYLFPGKTPPKNLLIVDCIEFNRRSRFADPVADISFLYMDLLFHGYKDLAKEFARTYFQTSGDVEGKDLLPFYTAYRSAVRAKVHGITYLEKDISEKEKNINLQLAKGHWLFTLGTLNHPSQRPCLVLVGWGDWCTLPKLIFPK